MDTLPPWDVKGNTVLRKFITPEEIGPSRGIAPLKNGVISRTPNDRAKIAKCSSKSRQTSLLLCRHQLEHHGVIKRQSSLIGIVRDHKRSEDQHRGRSTKRVGSHCRGITDGIADQGHVGLSDNAHEGGHETGRDCKPYYPRLTPLSGVGDGSEQWNRDDDKSRRNAIAKRYHRVRRVQIRHQPHREVKCRDVHRKDGVREIVKRPAPSLDCRSLHCPDFSIWQNEGIRMRWVWHYWRCWA